MWMVSQTAAVVPVIRGRNQNLTIAGDRAGGASEGGRGAESFWSGFGGWRIGFGASRAAGASVTGAGGLGGADSTTSRRPTTNFGDWLDATSGCGVSGAVAVWAGGKTGWLAIARRPTVSGGAEAGVVAVVAAGAGSACGPGDCVGSTETDVRFRSLSQ